MASTARRQIPRTPITAALVSFGRFLKRAIPDLDRATHRSIKAEIEIAERMAIVIEKRLQSVEQVTDQVGAAGSTFPLTSTLALSVAPINSSGSLFEAARANHTHQGVHAISGAVGDVTIAGHSQVKVGNIFSFPGWVTVTSGDTDADYLQNKITAGTGVALAVLNPGVSEELEVSVSSSTLPIEFLPTITGAFAGNVTFGLPWADAIESSCILVLRGRVLKPGLDFTIAGTVLTMTVAPFEAADPVAVASYDNFYMLQCWRT